MVIDNINTLTDIIENINIGVAAVDEQNRLVAWNKFMVKNSGIQSAELMGQNLFDAFSYLPRQWMELKMRSVRLIKNYSFVSWTQKPYLFRFKNNRMMNEQNIEFMHQDCTFIPVTNAETKETYVCITVTDMTDVVASHKKLTEINDINKTLEHITNHDALTSLFNRAYVEEQISREFDKAKRYGNPFSLVFFDIDKFKHVNDTWGHLAGDEVLKNVADTVRNQLRAPDIFGRYGGEEFLILLPETAAASALHLSQRLKKGVGDMITRFGENEIRITISMGLVQFRPDIGNYLQMIHEADVALYHSKTGGRNAITQYKTTGCELVK